MILDDVVDRALGECEKFLSSCPYGSTEETVEAVGPLIKAANLVLAALNFTFALRKDIGISVELGRVEGKFKLSHMHGKMRTPLMLLQDGSILKDVEQLCDEGCHDIGSEQELMESLEEALSQGISAETMAKNIRKFLANPQVRVSELIPDVVN